VGSSPAACFFPGLMVCGVCGSGPAEGGANPVGCSAVSNKGSSICSNWLRIS
jgi:hypothetical protein